VRPGWSAGSAARSTLTPAYATSPPRRSGHHPRTDARQDIEDFEAGVRRALRETGADGGSGFVVEDGVAPWTDLDVDDPVGTEQTRALVEEFEDGVRRALARLDQVAGRTGRPSALFERRAGTELPPGHERCPSAGHRARPANGGEPATRATCRRTAASRPVGCSPANGGEPRPPCRSPANGG
jgi:hypothetical protein